MPLELKSTIPWGRSLEEYSLMFALSERDFQKRILGCADGPASFNIEATNKNFKVISCDPLYAFTSNDIRKRIDEVVPVIREQMQMGKDEYIWTKYRSVEHLVDSRIATMNTFLDDYSIGKSEGRYITAELPTLPFGDNAFDLALVSHFLFLYSNHFDLEFHISSICELLRVAKEVRIYPLVTLASQISPFIDSIKKTFESDGYQVTLAPCNYEFQRNATHYMRIQTSDAL